MMFIYILSAAGTIDSLSLNQTAEIHWLAQMVTAPIADYNSNDKQSLITTLKLLPPSQRRNITEQALMLTQGHSYNIEKITRLMRIIKSEPEPRREPLNRLVKEKLGNYLGSIEEYIHVIYALRGITLRESSNIIDHLQNILANFSIEVGSRNHDFGAIIKQIIKINASQRVDVINYIHNIAIGRSGTLREFSFLMMNMSDVHALHRWNMKEALHRLSTIPNDQENQSPILRRGAVSEISILMGRLYIFMHHHETLLDQMFAYADGNPHLTLTDLCKKSKDLEEEIPLDSPMFSVYNMADLYHVHKEASIYLIPIWQSVNNILKEKKVSQIMSYKKSIRLLKNWIKKMNKDITAGIGDHKTIQSLLLQLPQHQMWGNAMNSDFSYLGAGVTGSTILRTIVAFCCHKRENIPALLIQCLYDSATAFSETQTTLVTTSCERGIPERALTCLGVSDILNTISRIIFENEQYQKLFSITDDCSIDALAPYQGDTTIANFKQHIQTDLLDLKEVLKAQLKQTYTDNLIERIFSTQKIRNMFDIFDNIQDIATQNHIAEAFMRLHSHS